MEDCIEYYENEDLELSKEDQFNYDQISKVVKALTEHETTDRMHITLARVVLKNENDEVIEACENNEWKRLEVLGNDMNDLTHLLAETNDDTLLCVKFLGDNKNIDKVVFISDSEWNIDTKKFKSDVGDNPAYSISLQIKAIKLSELI